MCPRKNEMNFPNYLNDRLWCGSTKWSRHLALIACDDWNAYWLAETVHGRRMKLQSAQRFYNEHRIEVCRLCWIFRFIFAVICYSFSSLHSETASMKLLLFRGGHACESVCVSARVTEDASFLVLSKIQVRKTFLCVTKWERSERFHFSRTDWNIWQQKRNEERTHQKEALDCLIASNNNNNFQHHRTEHAKQQSNE